MKNTMHIFCSLLLFVLALGCQPTQRVEPTSEQSEVERDGEPLEGPMYEPSGLESNPARPRSSRPATP